MQQIRTILHQCLTLSILSVFFIGPTYLQLYWSWLPTSQFGIFAIVIPVYIAIALWLLLGMLGLSNTLSDHRWIWIVGVFTFTIWVWISTRWSLFPSISQATVPAIALTGLFAFITASTGPSPKQVMIALAAGIIVQTVVSIGQMVVQHPLGLIGLGEYVLKPNNYGLSIVVVGSERIMRAYGLSTHPNALGGYFAFATVCTVTWLFDTDKVACWRSIVRLVVVVLGLWGLYVSFSRSAWGAFAVGISVLIFFRWRKSLYLSQPSLRKVLQIVLPLVAVTVLFLTLYSKFLITRTGSTGEPTELRSISDRAYYTRIAMRAISEHPLQGIGAGAFPDFAKQVISEGPYANQLPADHVHNVPLLILSELGIIGLVIWIAMWGGSFISLWKHLRDPYAISLLAGIIALLVTGLLDHFTWTMIHFLFILWGAMGVVLRHSFQQDEDVAEDSTKNRTASAT